MAEIDLDALERDYMTPVLRQTTGATHILALIARVRAAEAALSRINDVRNSIVGSQQFNWSAHAYPLVAALDEAGIQGLPYPEAKKRHEQVFEENERLKVELAHLRKEREAEDAVVDAAIEFVKYGDMGGDMIEYMAIETGLDDKVHALLTLRQKQEVPSG